MTTHAFAGQMSSETRDWTAVLDRAAEKSVVLAAARRAKAEAKPEPKDRAATESLRLPGALAE